MKEIFTCEPDRRWHISYEILMSLDLCLTFYMLFGVSLSSYYSLLIKSHLQSYPCPLQINFFWNFGFLLGITIILQIITGILLSLHYTSDINTAYFSIFFIIREIFFGWSLRYLHSSGASFVFCGSSPNMNCNRMGFWRILCLQSNIEEVFYIPFHITIYIMWIYYYSYFLFTFTIF